MARPEHSTAPREHTDRAGIRSALWLPIFDDLADPVVVARLAAEAEEAGWHGVFVWDHLRWRAPVRQVVLGVTFEFQNTNFDGIIGGLDAGRYDLSLTSMIDKLSRQGTVDFVDYLNSGVTFMVVKGNPKGLKDKLDLCGKTAAVEKSATGDLSADDISKECAAAGRPAVNKQPFPDQASAVQALQSGRADAVLALDLTLAYNVKQSPEAFEIASKPFGTLPVGIPVPKSNPQLRDAVQAALKKVIASGTYDALLVKWNLTDQALKDAPINQGK